jgi:fibro-slime domain-containing protein
MNRARRSRSRRATATSAGERARVALALGACLAAGCAARTNATPDAAGAAGTFGFAGATGAGGQAGALVLDPIPDTGYTPTDVGGYQLGRLIPASQIQETLPATSSVDCFRLRGIVRDFKGALPAVGGSFQPGGHPDFEVFEGKGITRGLVGPALGPTRKPSYASKCELGAAAMSADCPYGAMTTSAANFGQWYTSVDGVNMTYFVYFQLVGPNLGKWTFSSSLFFPLDKMGFGNSGLDADGKTPRNYSFTTEIHTTFRYNGGEQFTFNGDDDVWIFINGNRAVDLGGLHGFETGTVDLDTQAATLGIEKGSVYHLDLFHAERHSVESHFGFDLNFAFEDCGYIIP